MGSKKGSNQQKKTKSGPGYEGVDPAAECNINKTSKFAVWDAPGVSQPVAVKPNNNNKENTTPTKSGGGGGNFKQKQNNNKKFLAASPSATTTDSGGAGGGKGFPPTTKLGCQCGEVVIALPGPALNRLECCCTDCRFAVEWCTKNLGGPTLEHPSPYFVDLIYFENCFQIEKGGDNLDVMMIKKGYNTKRVIATCCGTPLIGDHPFYQSKKLVAYNILPESKSFTANKTFGEMMPPQRRIFEDDYSSAEQAKIWLEAPFNKPPENKPSEVKQQLDSDILNKWKSKHPRYTNIQRLIGSIGPIQYMDPSFEGKEPEWNRKVREATAAGN